MQGNQPQYRAKPKGGVGVVGVIAIVFGVLAVLGLGAIAFCVAALKGNLAAADTAAAAASASAAKEGASFVPLLAKLASDPKSLPPRTTKPAKDETVFMYDDPKGTPLHGLQAVVRKTPGSWSLSFTAASGVTAQDFAPGSTSPAPASAGSLTAVDDGPLKGAIVSQSGQQWQVMSAAYALETAAGGEKTLDWVCDTGRAPTVKSIDTADLKVQCEGMVKAKLRSPSTAEFPGVFDSTALTTDNKCVRSWHGWVDAQNAFGAKIRNNFVCTHNPSTNLVTLTMD